jgi:hypothetical protein
MKWLEIIRKGSLPLIITHEATYMTLYYNYYTCAAIKWFEVQAYCPSVSNVTAGELLLHKTANVAHR